MTKKIANNIKLNREWNSIRNFPATVENTSLGSSKKFWWKCDKGHEWEAIVKNRSLGNTGCPYCTNKIAFPENDLEHNFPDVAKEWHQIKNKNLTPADITYGSSKKVWWQCGKGHEWEAAVTSRTKLNATGCPFCSGNLLANENSLQEKNPLLVGEWNHKKNGNLNPARISYGSSRKVWWICSLGHEWKATVSNRMGRNSGCPYCTSKKSSENNNFANSFPKLLREWDYLLNKNNEPTKFTPKSKKKVWWKCINGHFWEATIQSRANGSGCPNCSNQSSKPEMRLLSEFRFLFSEVKNRQKFDGDEIDIFLPALNIGVEFDGSFFHKNKVDKDKEKNQRLKEKGITVIRVRPYPLEKISKHDISIASEEITKKDIDNLLKNIFKISYSKITNPIKNYFKEKYFVNDETYRAYISYFPNPLPEASLSQTNPSVSNEWDFEKNKPLTPDNFTSGSSQKCWWICKNKHSYETAIVSRTTGHGCPYCSGNAVHYDNSLASLNSQLVNQFDLDKNSPLSANDFTIGSTKKVWWKCENGHSWEAAIYNRTKKNNPTACPYCSQKKATPKYNLDILFPDLIKEWSSEKNGDLLPSLLLPGSGKKVWWRCSAGHEWESTINRRTRGAGCPACYKKNIETQKSLVLDSNNSHKSITRGKPVKCIDTGEIFISASAAEVVMRSRGIAVGGSKVLLCCKGKRNFAGGYRWEWG